jgi:hypothetical protein
LHSNHHVTDDFKLGRHEFRHHAANRVADFRASSAGQPDTSAADLGRFDAGASANRGDSLVERLAGALLTHPDNIAGSSRGGSKDRGLVAHNASGLTSASVDAEKDGHEPTSTTPISLTNCPFVPILTCGSKMIRTAMTTDRQDQQIVILQRIAKAI